MKAAYRVLSLWAPLIHYPAVYRWSREHPRLALRLFPFDGDLRGVVLGYERIRERIRKAAAGLTSSLNRLGTTAGHFTDTMNSFAKEARAHDDGHGQ